MKGILFLLVIGSAIIGCTAVKPAGDKKNMEKLADLPTSDKNIVELAGTIEELGMSTFQYGTHILRCKTKIYALKCSIVNLDLYLGREIIIKGIKVKGYPIENGPEFIDVTWVEK